MRLDPGLLGYKAPRIDAFYREVLRQLKDLPRIESLSLVGSPPFGSYGSLGGPVTAEGSSPDPASTPIEVGIHVAGPRFFQTMGFPIVAGRDFDERDAADATPVAILSSAEAVRLFGSDRNAIGKRVIPPEEFNAPPLQVIGVFDKRPKDTGFRGACPLLDVPAAPARTRHDARGQGGLCR